MPYYQCLWLGSSWSCLWISYVLASDRKWTLCFVSSHVFHYNVSQMRTEHIFVIWRCIRIKGYSPPHPIRPPTFGSNKQFFYLPFLGGNSVAFLLYLCIASVASYVAFVLSLLVRQLSFFGASGRLCFLLWHFLCSSIIRFGYGMYYSKRFRSASKTTKCGHA